MKMKPRMSAAAIWLLKVFKVAENNPALAGDLTEEYLGRQRAAWLWRQVLAAIAFTVAKEIFSHKLLTIRALIAGEVAVLLSSLVLMKGLYSPVLMRFLMTDVPHWMLHFNLFLGASVMGSIIGGWVVGRLSRDHLATLLLIFFTLQVIVIALPFPDYALYPKADAITLYRHLVESIDQPRFRPYLVLDLKFLAMNPLAVLFGGYLSHSRGENQSSGSGLQGDTV
jgi:hypothetical protein